MSAITLSFRLPTPLHFYLLHRRASSIKSLLQGMGCVCGLSGWTVLYSCVLYCSSVLENVLHVCATQRQRMKNKCREELKMDLDLSCIANKQCTSIWCKNACLVFQLPSVQLSFSWRLAALSCLSASDRLFGGLSEYGRG